MSLAEACSEWKIDPETLLTRLQAGLPSVQADDFESGEASTSGRWDYAENWGSREDRQPGQSAAGAYTIQSNKVIHHVLASWRPEWIGTD
jgi:hypothetical protein